MRYFLSRKLCFVVLACLSFGQLQAQCSGDIYDSGGASGNYSNNENISNTYFAPEGGTITLTFNSFNVENNYDYLHVYDGADDSATLLQSLTGTNNPGAITSSGNSLTVKFISDGIISAAGYHFTLSCSSDLPCADITSAGLIAYYNFEEGTGSTINDLSDVGDPLNLSIENTSNVSWIGECGLDVNSGTRASSSIAAEKIISAVKSTNAITLEAWVRPANTTQTNTARIVSISSSSSNRNITLGQDGNKYTVRSRTSSTTTNVNGMPEITEGNVSTAYVQHVVYTWDGNTSEEKIFVDNIEYYSGVRLGDLSNWDDSYKLSFLDELTGSREWLGSIHSVSFYNKALTSAEVAQNYNAGSCCNGNEGLPAIYGCADGNEIEMFYTGIQNDVPKTLSFNNIGDVDSVLVEVVYKGGNPGNTTTVEDDAGNSYTNFDYQSIGSNAHIYSFWLPSTSSVTYSNTNQQNNAQSLLAYVYRSGQPGKMYTATSTNIIGNGDTKTLTLPLPNRDEVQDVLIAIPMSEITYDNKSLNFYATAGASTASESRTWGPGDLGFVDGCCIDSVHILLENVDPSVTFAKVDIESPSTGGQSYVIGGLVFAEISCFGPEICNDEIDNDNDGLTDCEDLDCGEVLNREFDEGLDNWMMSNGVGNSSMLVLDQTWMLSGGNSGRVDITSTSGVASDVKLQQDGLSLISGKSYTVFFDARSTTAKTITSEVQLRTSPFTSFFSGNFVLTNEPVTHSYTFIAGSTTSAASLSFGLGTDTNDVWIDNVQLQESCISVFDCNSECTEPYRFDWFNGTDGAVWEITNGQQDVTRVYPLTGSQGTYNVTVTMDNPYGQNIDFSNCGTGPTHFYTGTCNDPNASTNCDGDDTTADAQFTYDCSYLTFGVTSDNNDQYTSIRYDFEVPTVICNFEIGDIDHQGSGSGPDQSWQDEVDVTANNGGVPVAINAVAGQLVTANNNNSTALNLLSVYSATSTGNLNHNDPDGHAFITTLGEVTSITFKYSNGPEDDGVSNDHAIRIAGFDFCPQVKEICDNGIDDDGDGDEDCEDFDCGLIDNREFDFEMTNWDLSLSGSNTAIASQDNNSQLSGVNSAFVDVTNASGENWEIQFLQGGLSLEQGKNYVVYFDARATQTKEILVALQENGTPWTPYAEYTTNITTSGQSYSFNFIATEDSDNAKLYFGLGSDNTDVWIDRVQVKELCTVCEANAGPDQSQCYDASFNVSANVAIGAAGFWSVQSGTATALDPLFFSDNVFSVPAGTSAVLRWTVSNGLDCEVYDEITLTNTDDCSFECVDPLNVNGDLEQGGSAEAFDLSLNGNPATLIQGNSNPVGWEEKISVFHQRLSVRISLVAKPISFRFGQRHIAIVDHKAMHHL